MKLLNRFTFCFIAAASIVLAQPPGGGPGQQSGDGIWERDALWGESQTFDKCLGHQPGSGMYHHHVQPVCLRAQLDDNVVAVRTSRTGTTYKEKDSGWKHSPILGWAFDGYPIYGPYGYADPKSAASAIKRVKSSFRPRTVTTRTTLPDWALAFHTGATQQLSAAQSGPPVNKEFPIGRYVEDNDFVAGSGDLDVYNGRLTVTPEFPQGTYAYFVTVNDDGSPAFPYFIGLQYYGTVSGGSVAQTPSGAQGYFANGAYTQPASSAPVLNSWFTKNATTVAKSSSGWDPSAGPSPTWPFLAPAGSQSSGGVSTPQLADVQQISFTDTTAYINSNNLASYTMGPWFAFLMSGGVFGNWPSSSALRIQLPRAPTSAAAKRTTGMGPIGIWVNGIAAFNALDGASWSAASSADSGGGLLTPGAVHLSAASSEGGPLAPGALVSGFAYDGAELATSAAAADSTNWPTTLGGSTVTIRDSAGVRRTATIAYASPGQVNYRLPEDLATGPATVTIAVNGQSFNGGINIAANYPDLFQVNAEALAAGQILRVHNGQRTDENLYQVNAAGAVSALPISLGAGSDQVYLVLYGTGLGKADQVKITIGGVAADAIFAGAQGTYPGLDQYDVPIPSAVAGRGKVDVVVTAGGHSSNPVNIVVQ